jgi:hypothetical protein
MNHSSSSLHYLVTNVIRQFSLCGISFLFHVVVGIGTFGIGLSSFISLQSHSL